MKNLFRHAAILVAFVVFPGIDDCIPSWDGTDGDGNCLTTEAALQDAEWDWCDGCDDSSGYRRYWACQNPCMRWDVGVLHYEYGASGMYPDGTGPIHKCPMSVNATCSTCIDACADWGDPQCSDTCTSCFP